MKLHNLDNLPKTKEKLNKDTYDFDEDHVYSYLKSTGIEEMDIDRAMNDEVHGITLGMSKLINKKETKCHYRNV